MSDDKDKKKEPQHMTVHLDLPEADVKTLKKKGLKVEVEKIVNKMLRDQSRKMVASDGCISNPGGPSC
jgi:hypothetical protein